VCPRCGKPLVVGEPTSGSRDKLIWEVRCVSCRKSTFAAEVAESRLLEDEG
jgi:hypothetical protein